LKLAKDQLENAKKLARDGDGELAGMTLSRARVDAELALALAREAQARDAALTASQQNTPTEVR
jgi:hypothetical protein